MVKKAFFRKKQTLKNYDLNPAPDAGIQGKTGEELPPRERLMLTLEQHVTHWEQKSLMRLFHSLSGE